MRSTLKASLLVLSASLLACTTNTSQSGNGSALEDVRAPDASENPSEAAKWVDQFVQGTISSDELAAALEPLIEDVKLRDIAAEAGVHILGGDQAIDTELVISPNVTVVLTAGTTLTLQDDVTLESQGRLIALGNEAAPVRVTSLATYRTLRLTGGFSAFHQTFFSHGVDLVTVQNTEKTIQRFENSSFEHWQDVALRFVAADGLVVRHSTFGLESDKEAHGECLNGKQSAALIEGCTFGAMADYADVMDLEDCQGNNVPHIVGNTLLGGQDDGIDLDTCDALVVGNLIQDFWPPDPSNPYKGVNGGGITGHSSSPLLINNVVLRCFHGIGFKNGARPVLIHNTITDGNIGVSLYRTNSDYDDPHGTLVNNIIVGNVAYDTGGNQDLLLHGRWWPSYDPSPGDQASVELVHNLFGIDVGGTSDRIGEMSFAWFDDLPYPGADSLAAKAGTALPIEVEGLELQEIEEYVAFDFTGQSRNQGAPTIGALEVKP